MSQRRLHILGIAGSLRQKSYNRGLLRAAQNLAPKNVEIEIFDLAPIPMYNEDLLEQGAPEPVKEFKDRIKAADALLIATPEYNYNIPGVLKNAIDWASRPPTDRIFYHKPIAIMGASTGQFGTVRSQLALRQVFVFTDSYVLPKPEVLVFRAAERFDDQSNLTDEDTQDHVRGLVVALAEWAVRVRDS